MPPHSAVSDARPSVEVPAPAPRASAVAPTPFTAAPSVDQILQLQAGPGNRSVSRFLSAGRVLVQRYDPPGGATATVPPAAPSAETARRLAYQATVLRNTPEMSADDRRALGGVLAGFPVYELLLQRGEKRRELESVHQSQQDYQRRNEALGRGEELSGGVGASPELMRDLEDQAARLTHEIESLTQRITPMLQELGTDEEGLTRRVTEEFPRLWLARAGQIAEGMLAENEQVVRHERDRYRSNVCSEDTEGLLAVDRRLVALQAEHDDLERRRDELDRLLRSASEPLPGGVRDTPDLMGPDREALARVDEQLRDVDQRQRTERDINGLVYPILLSAGYTPGALQNLPDGELEQRLGTWTESALENIAATRANIADGTLKLWDLRDIPELTWVALGLPPDGALGRVVANHRERERSQEQAVQVAVAALAITAAAVATIATAGGAIVVAAAAAGAGAGIGLVQLGRDVHRYSAESAAGGVSIDPALADISRNEPELLPIVMDIVALGMDAVGAVGIARAAMQAERTMLAAGRAADFASEIRRLVPDEAVASRIIQRASQSAEITANVEAAALAAGAAARSTGNVRLAQLVLQLSAEDNVFAEWAARLAAQNRVTLATDAAIRARFTNPTELAEALAALGRMGSVADGWYSPRLGLFVKAANPHTMAIVLVHEAVHFLQHANGRLLINFLSEFQAFAAQRDYLLGVVRVSGRGTVPANLHWLIDNDLPAVAARVSAMYQGAFPALAAQYAIPASFSPNDELHQLALMVTAAMAP